MITLSVALVLLALIFWVSHVTTGRTPLWISVMFLIFLEALRTYIIVGR